MKVQTIEQRLSLTKKNGCRYDVERVDQAGSQILPHRGHAASDLDVFAGRRNEKCPGNLLSCQGRLLDRNQDFPH
jgi:hypothetical protein